MSFVDSHLLHPLHVPSFAPSSVSLFLSLFARFSFFLLLFQRSVIAYRQSLYQSLCRLRYDLWRCSLGTWPSASMYTYNPYPCTDIRPPSCYQFTSFTSPSLSLSSPSLLSLSLLASLFLFSFSFLFFNFFFFFSTCFSLSSLASGDLMSRRSCPRRLDDYSPIVASHVLADPSSLFLSLSWLLSKELEANRAYTTRFTSLI